MEKEEESLLSIITSAASDEGCQLSPPPHSFHVGRFRRAWSSQGRQAEPEEAVTEHEPEQEGAALASRTRHHLQKWEQTHPHHRSTCL